MLSWKVGNHKEEFELAVELTYIAAVPTKYPLLRIIIVLPIGEKKLLLKGTYVVEYTNPTCELFLIKWNIRGSLLPNGKLVLVGPARIVYSAFAIITLCGSMEYPCLR